MQRGLTTNLRRLTQKDYSKSTDLTMGGLDLDTAIRLRWALRDIKAKRTKLTPVSPSDLMTLMEIGLVEMRDDAPMLTNEAIRHLIDECSRAGLIYSPNG